FSVLEKIDTIKPLTKSNNNFSDLCETIINQQLSGKAGETIFRRFKKLFSKDLINPEELCKLSAEKIRKVGTSNSKVKYLKDLAEKIHRKEIDLENLAEKDDLTIKNSLMKIKGIGPWTAEMFLMFSLARQDIFSLGDLGLRKAIQKLYAFKKKPTDKQIEKLSKKWIPYRTYAARILWRSMELKKK
ncbi:DNA-3-methyladenine glycosylase 2 family protein, partial [Candidatus Gottesmanbacteria bacterium]|nr:DNA-3-methyladenine glycosylase 2 family protein [Candidatus Gottesmanbacteria bacterium]